MNRILKKYIKRLIGWATDPEDGELSDLEVLQAEKLAMASGLEMLASLIIQSNGLMTKDLMAAQFRAHAAAVLETASKKEKGDFERLSLEITAAQLDDIANNIMGNHSEKEN